MDFKIIIKKLNNTLSKSERVMFNEWYNESVEHKRYFKNVKDNYRKDIELVDAEKGWQSISNKIELKPKKTNYWKNAVAASMVLLLSISLIYKYSNKKQHPTPQIVNAVIEPGRDKATLTLEDGSEITLEKGTAYQSTISVSDGEQITYQSSNQNTSEIKYNYLTIPTGGQFQITLSDGTKVWLNSESQLKYPTTFVDGEPRQVELVYGEAYFDVSPSTKHKGSKFKVLNQSQEIEVLGTEFNVKAYKDETNIYTTLVEGKVTVNLENKAQVLFPNQQSNVNLKNNNIKVSSVDVYREISWKDGVFSFKNKPLKDIMKVLSRWYEIDVIFENKDIEDITFNGALEKKLSIVDILSIININYEINGKTVLLK